MEQAKALGVPPKLEDLLIDESWREALGGEFSKPYMRKLGDFLSTEWQQHSIYPRSTSSSGAICSVVPVDYPGRYQGCAEPCSPALFSPLVNAAK